jgi:hypothetical protein
MGTIDETVAVEVAEYEQALRSIKQPGGTVNFMDHPGGKYLVTGFTEGVKRGFQVGVGAAHAGINTVIGNLDNGMYDAEDAKTALIALRNFIQKDAGL